VVRKTRAASDVPATFGAGVAKLRERARRASHALATRLVAGVRDVLLPDLLHPLHTYLLAMAPVRLAIT